MINLSIKSGKKNLHLQKLTVVFFICLIFFLNFVVFQILMDSSRFKLAVRFNTSLARDRTSSIFVYRP